MTEIAKLLSDESKIVFANGTVIQGAESVAQVMLGACEAYNKGYMSTFKKGAMIGVACGLVGYTAVKIYIKVKKPKK